MLVKRVRPNFKKLGPKYGKIMKQLSQEIQLMGKDAIAELEKEGEITFKINKEKVLVTLDDVEIMSDDIPGWLVGSEGRVTVALDITLTDELQKEGIARELVNRIQNLRKSKDFEITDRIAIKVSSHGEFNEAIRDYADYIQGQVLAESINIVDEQLEDEISIDDTTLTLHIERI